MTELEHAIKHIKTRADAWAVKEVTEALRSISEQLDKALSQEPCDYAVSREGVIKTINNNTADERDGWLCIDNDLVHEIEKLPSVNPQPCDDAISREDAVHALRKALWDYEDKTEKQYREHDDLDYEEWYFHRIFVQAMNDEDVEAICKLPSVTQKSGKWKKYNGLSKLSTEEVVICDQCAFVTYKDSYYKYCPNCGANMESEDME